MLYHRGISNILQATIQYSVPERTKIFWRGSDVGHDTHSVNSGGRWWVVHYGEWRRSGELEGCSSLILCCIIAVILDHLVSI